MILPSTEEDYYWRLTLRDGREVDIPPKFVDLVKKKMDAREPVHTTNGSIPFSLIESFDRTSRRFTDVALLEQVAQAFREPVITEEGAVKARWVKKQVSASEYDKRYSKNPHYQRLSDDGSMITVGFVLPVHMFDSRTMEYCTIDEEKMLDKR